MIEVTVAYPGGRVRLQEVARITSHKRANQPLPLSVRAQNLFRLRCRLAGPNPGKDFSP
jgi:hypothetical protein